jgi:hypothetical protein
MRTGFNFINKKRGEIATIVTLVSLLVLSVVTVTSVSVLNRQRISTSSRAMLDEGGAGGAGSGSSCVRFTCTTKSAYYWKNYTDSKYYISQSNCASKTSPNTSASTACSKSPTVDLDADSSSGGPTNACGNKKCTNASGGNPTAVNSCELNSGGTKSGKYCYCDSGKATLKNDIKTCQMGGAPAGVGEYKCIPNQACAAGTACSECTYSGTYPNDKRYRCVGPGYAKAVPGGLNRYSYNVLREDNSCPPKNPEQAKTCTPGRYGTNWCTTCTIGSESVEYGKCDSKKEYRCVGADFAGHPTGTFNTRIKDETCASKDIPGDEKTAPAHACLDAEGVCANGSDTCSALTPKKKDGNATQTTACGKNFKCCVPDDSATCASTATSCKIGDKTKKYYLGTKGSLTRYYSSATSCKSWTSLPSDYKLTEAAFCAASANPPASSTTCSGVKACDSNNLTGPGYRTKTVGGSLRYYKSTDANCQTSATFNTICGVTAQQPPPETKQNITSLSGKVNVTWSNTSTTDLDIEIINSTNSKRISTVSVSKNSNSANWTASGTFSSTDRVYAKTSQDGKTYNSGSVPIGSGQSITLTLKIDGQGDGQQVPDSNPSGTKGLGEACDVDSQCKEGLCRDLVGNGMMCYKCEVLNCTDSNSQVSYSRLCANPPICSIAEYFTQNNCSGTNIEAKSDYEVKSQWCLGRDKEGNNTDDAAKRSIKFTVNIAINPLSGASYDPSKSMTAYINRYPFSLFDGTALEAFPLENISPSELVSGNIKPRTTTVSTNAFSRFKAWICYTNPQGGQNCTGSNQVFKPTGDVTLNIQF